MSNHVFINYLKNNHKTYTDSTPTIEQETDYIASLETQLVDNIRMTSKPRLDGGGQYLIVKGQTYVKESFYTHLERIKLPKARGPIIGRDLYNSILDRARLASVKEKMQELLSLPIQVVEPVHLKYFSPFLVPYLLDWFARIRKEMTAVNGYTDRKVLILCGESGTGKTLLADLIMQMVGILGDVGDSINFTDHRYIHRMAQHYVVHLEEFDKTVYNDSGKCAKFKELANGRNVHARVSHGSPETLPNHTSFLLTSNSYLDELFKDENVARRLRAVTFKNPFPAEFAATDEAFEAYRTELMKELLSLWSQAGAETLIKGNTETVLTPLQTYIATNYRPTANAGGPFKDAKWVYIKDLHAQLTVKYPSKEGTPPTQTRVIEAVLKVFPDIKSVKKDGFQVVYLEEAQPGIQPLTGKLCYGKTASEETEEPQQPTEPKSKDVPLERMSEASLRKHFSGPELDAFLENRKTETVDDSVETPPDDDVYVGEDIPF